MRKLRMLVVVGIACTFLLGLVLPAKAAALRVEDDDLSLRFSGRWKHVWSTTSSGASTRVSRSAGSWAYVSFEGTQCAVIARTGPDRGKAAVYFDGVLNRYIDLYSATASRPRSVWATSSVAPGWHSVKVVVLGTKRAASRDRWVDIDAFEIGAGAPAGWAAPGTLVSNGNSNLLAGRTWSLSTRPGPIGGSSIRTKLPGATVTIRFKGTAVWWLGRKDVNSGKAEVLVDGVKVATVGLHSPSSKERRVIWSTSDLAYGEHTLTIRALGRGVYDPTKSVVDFDAFAIKGTLLKAQRPSPFKYPWGTYIVIDKSSFRLYWVRKGILVKVYPIAHGKPGTPTPSRIWRVDAKYMTDPSGIYGPRKMRLFKQVRTSTGYRYVFTAYGVHGTNQPWVIGTQASHGCIRMYNRDVLELWPQVPIGTMVVTKD